VAITLRVLFLPRSDVLTYADPYDLDDALIHPPVWQFRWSWTAPPRVGAGAGMRHRGSAADIRDLISALPDLLTH